METALEELDTGGGVGRAKRLGEGRGGSERVVFTSWPTGAFE